ncbi:MAG: hypothetical protein WD749_08070 [Phycisphaerales bacterium]
MDHTLLCESCGYEVAGLPGDARCSECGRPVADSSPERRAGSPWQRSPSLLAFLETNIRAVRRTRSLFDSIRIDIPSGIGLAAANHLLAAFLIVLPWSGVLIADPVRSARVSALWVVPLQTATVACLLFLLTMVEWTGIQAYARSRRWRLTPAAAWQVCAHASVGWVITGLTSWVGLIAWLNLSTLGGSTVSVLGELFAWSVPAFGAVFGLVIFELLVWTGLQRCRFANAPASPGLAVAR